MQILVRKQNSEYRYEVGTYAESVEILKEEVVSEGPDSPYKETEITLKVKFKEYNPDYGDEKLCECGHSYYRHFDSYEGMAPVGCKYCGCREFRPATKKEFTGF